MSFRHLRLNELIKVELGKFFLREAEFPVGALVTITRVQTAPDLLTAKVFISVFPEKLNPVVLGFLTRQIYFWQQKLNRQLSIRPVPRLIFCPEKEVVVASRVEELLEQVKEGPVEKKEKKW